MALNFKIVLLAGVLGINTAQAYSEADKEYLTITTMNVSRVSKDVLNQEVLEHVSTKQLNVNGNPNQIPGIPNKMGKVSLDQVGQVLAVAQGVVALGESVYTLVQRGKPHNTTTYAPISVLPRNGSDLVDIFETEEWKAPKRFTYEITYTNGFNMDVVKFRYSVIYAYGGKYNGAGAYITAAQIIPQSVSTLFGFDFSATMKLGGLMNHGKKGDPLAGAILTLQYTVETVLQASVETLNYHIMGNGGFKKL
jgi:hypothetical protein